MYLILGAKSLPKDTTMPLIDITSFLNNAPPQPRGFRARHFPREEMLKPILDMTGRMSNPRMFPISQIDLNVRELPNCNNYQPQSIPTMDIDPTAASVANFFELGKSRGEDSLVELCESYIADIQQPPYPVRCCITSGCSDSLTKLLMLFLRPNDVVLCEQFGYPPTWAVIESFGGKFAGVPCNLTEEGPVLKIDLLNSILDRWPEEGTGYYAKPRILYLILTHNPLGITYDHESRSKIYHLCQKHNLLIIEDDPDGNIRLGDFDSYESYLLSRKHVSFLNMDEDGRVIRLESFNKTLFPGLRLGFVAARQEVINFMTMASEVYSKAPSGVSQALFIKTLKLHGDGYHGYLQWCYKLSKEYKRRVSVFFKAIESTRSYRSGYIIPVKPDGGMFFLIKFCFPEGIPGLQTEEIYYMFLRRGLVVDLGTDMVSSLSEINNVDFVRLRVSNIASDTLLKEAAHRFDEATFEYFLKFRHDGAIPIHQLVNIASDR
ncbi:CYFA0S02e10638g1_1 [Cyberlindnera fabianii]|uniref:CYFA0S02e10638g1_1 n=1 Tax=Cyberlindnera fabianii TaxID=36022 RepID=A0A061AWE3_CYBFA|nr:CYFA0S02e10638g1_1 [Cyberlindnera fabianii]